MVAVMAWLKAGRPAQFEEMIGLEATRIRESVHRRDIETCRI